MKGHRIIAQVDASVLAEFSEPTYFDQLFIEVVAKPSMGVR